MTNTTNPTTGFYSNDTDVFYVTPMGRVWLVAAEDELPEVVEVTALPDDVWSLDSGFVTPEEAIQWCGQIQEKSGEKLVEGE